MRFNTAPSSVLGCPVVKKRKLEEAVSDESEAPSKRRSVESKQAADEGFTAESDTTEEEVEAEGEEQEEEEGKDKKRNKTKVKTEARKGKK